MKHNFMVVIWHSQDGAVRIPYVYIEEAIECLLDMVDKVTSQIEKDLPPAELHRLESNGIESKEIMAEYSEEGLRIFDESLAEFLHSEDEFVKDVEVLATETWTAAIERN